MFRQLRVLRVFVILLFVTGEAIAQCGKGYQPSGLELVVNGDFSQGNTGFSCQYLHIEPGPPIQFGQYDVGVNPTQYYSGFSTCLGHTSGTTSDSMMIVDGASTPGTIVWCQTINVVPNTDYLFSTWVTNMLQGPWALAELQFSINGVPLGNIFSPDSTACVWDQFFANWNSGANTTASICILNQNLQSDGNDFAMDDISFQPCVCYTPIKDVGPDTAICVGTSAQLEADTNSVTYAWTPAAGLSAINIPDPIASPTVTTTYILNLSNGACTNSDTVRVIVSPLVNITSTIQNVLCNGACTGSVSVTNTGGIAPYSYSWSNASTQNNITGLCDGMYSVTVSDSVGCPVTLPVSITEPPVLTTSVTTVDAQCGVSDGEATSTVNGGTTNYTYSWSGGVTQTTASVTGLAGGNYTLSVTDANGCTSQSTFSIQSSGGLTATESVMPINCNGGTNATATVTPTGSAGPFTYSWSTNPVQTTTIATGLSSGTYTYSVNDLSGCVLIDTILITEPQVIAITVNTTPATCGLNNDGTATVNATGGTGTYTYSWSGTALITPQVNSLAMGAYSVTVTDNNGCTTQNTFSVSITGALQSTETITDALCFGSADGTAQVNTNSTSLPITYTWNTSPVQSNSTATGLISGAYSYTITDAIGCNVTGAISVSSPQALSVTILGPSNACDGEQVIITSTVSGGTSAYQYSWSTGAVTSSTTVSATAGSQYAVSVTDAKGCTAVSPSVSIDVYPPVVATTTNPGTVCAGTSSSLTITASATGGNGAYVYTWLSPLNQTQNSITVQLFQDTSFTVVVSDGCGSNPDTVIVTLLVIQPPAVFFSAMDTIGCAPWCMIFNKSITGNGVQSVWNYGNGSSDTLGTICYNQSGTYDVSLTATDGNGCSATYTRPMNVVVYANPIADFSVINNPLPSFDPNLNIIDHTSGAMEWYWNFGDSTGWIAGQQTSHFYDLTDEAGFYVTLAIEDSNGCVDTTIQYVEIKPDWTLYIPNTFTPGMEDIYNNVFKPMGVNVNRFEMWIFDRWGNKVFYTNDINEGWNGKVQGGSSDQIAQMDTYVYYISFWPDNTTFEKRVGHVNLLK